jgi:hypothetical protein
MNCYDSAGSRIEIGYKCKFQGSEGDVRDGTVQAVGVTSYPSEDGEEPRIQWEVLVHDASAEDPLARRWIPVSQVQVLGEQQ